MGDVGVVCVVCVVPAKDAWCCVCVVLCCVACCLEKSIGIQDKLWHTSIAQRTHATNTTRARVCALVVLVACVCWVMDEWAFRSESFEADFAGGL